MLQDLALLYQLMLQSQPAPNEQLEGMVLLAWKPKEISKGKTVALNLYRSRF